MEGVAPEALGVGWEWVAAELGPGHALAQRTELCRCLGEAAATEEVCVSERLESLVEDHLAQREAVDTLFRDRPRSAASSSASAVVSSCS